MPATPRISVLIPTYNYARYLPATIESVLAQQGTDFELLISDDASTDHSAQVIHHYTRRDVRIRPVVHSTNLGMVSNWNWCLRQARGEYVKFLFGDDLLASPTALADLAAMLDGHPRSVLAASARLLIDADTRFRGVWDDLPPGEHAGGAVTLRCLRSRRNLVGEPTAVMFRRRAAARGFDPTLRQVVDLEMWFHLLHSGSLVYTAEPLCAFRRHAAQQTNVNNRARLADREMLQIFERYLPALPAGGFTRHWIVFRQWHYLRKAAARGAPVDPTVCARLRAQMPLAWLVLCWACHRVSRPAENLHRKVRGWTQRLRQFVRPAAKAGAPAWPRFLRRLSSSRLMPDA